MFKALLPVLAVSLFLYPCALRAQPTNASITGRVTDPSKATIADAKVAVANTGTNFQHETATNDAGECRSRIYHRGPSYCWQSLHIKR